MKTLLLAFVTILTVESSIAQPAGWQPSQGYTQVKIWPGKAPDPQPVPGPEYVSVSKTLFVGLPVTSVFNVSEPTMTVYPAKGRKTGAAVVVFPGGGYMELAIDFEGTEVCDWLTAKGVTCILLKYRVPHGGQYWDQQLHREIDPSTQMALEDAQRTLGIVRFHAAEWGIDPHKIGVLGFSAGGHMVAATSTHFAHRLYRPVDAADNESCRPDFAVAIYPGHLALAENSIGLNPDIARNISAQTPPTFLIQNEDDHVDSVEDSLSYYFGLKKAGIPVEMHLYAQGGHAFGLRRTKLPVTAWPKLVETWLATIGMIPE